MFPVEIYEHILSFLNLRDKSKCKAVSKLWCDVVSKWKDDIFKEMKKHYRKYVRAGDISYFDSVPLIAQYYLLSWAIEYIDKANQKENIIFAINNYYDYYQPKLRSGIIPLMREDRIIDDYFSRTESLKWELLALAVESEDLDDITFMLNKIIMVKEYSTDNGRKFYKLLFTKNKYVIDTVLTHFNKINIIRLYQTNLIIQYAICNNHLEYVEKYFNGEHYRSAVIKGIIKNPHEEVYQQCLCYVKDISFSGIYWSSDSVSIGIIPKKSIKFFIKIFDALSLNYEQLQIAYFSILHHNQENMHLIHVITSYIDKRYCKGLYNMKKLINGYQYKSDNRSPEEKISKMISQFSVPIMKHLVDLGYELDRENIIKIVNNNRVDILKYLHSVDNSQLRIQIASVMIHGNLYSVNLETLVWLCNHYEIPKDIHATCNLIMNYDPTNEMGLINYLYRADFQFDETLFEKIIRDPHHRSQTEWKVSMCSFIYQKCCGFFDSKIIKQVFEAGMFSFNGCSDAIILKWFVEHGLSMTERMIYIDDITRIKWMIRHGCYYNKKWFLYKIERMQSFVSDRLVEYVIKLP